MAEILPGTEVHIRGLRWEVVDTYPLGEQTRFRLRGLDHALRGYEIDVLSPFEDVDVPVRAFSPENATPLNNWLVYHRAFLLEQRLGPNTLQAVRPGRLVLEPYQLVPVMRALNLSRTRLLLCDDVGLGKTIEAGLVIVELIARRLAHRVLIVSPPGPLLEQWKAEMRERFGLCFQVIDRAMIEEIRKQTERGANPFDSIQLGLASMDFLRQDHIIRDLERTDFDVVVIDEAHHVFRSGSADDRSATQRRKLAEVLAARSDALLLLTATPHDGYDRSFASLLELLDPCLVNARGEARAGRFSAHVVRRLKRHIVDPDTKEPRFKERTVIPCPVTTSGVDDDFAEMHRSIVGLVAPRMKSAIRSRRYDEVLSLFALLKRSVSSVNALLRTLDVVSERLQAAQSARAESQEETRQRLNTLREYQQKLRMYGTLSFEEEEEHARIQAEDIARQIEEIDKQVRSGSYHLRKNKTVIEALQEIRELAQAVVDRDPKLSAVVEQIRQIRETEPQANILVYTEYRDSQAVVVEALRRAQVGTVETISGEDPDADRKKVYDKFISQDNVILVSTDAAAEGLNLHERCHHLIHLELPFNPNRLEQRNGRIDRYGQKQTPVIRYLYLKETFEEYLLLRLIAKYENQRRNLHFMPNTLGVERGDGAPYEGLLAGLEDIDNKLFEPSLCTVDFNDPDRCPEDDAAIKALIDEIDRAFKAFETTAKSRAWLSDTGVNADAKLQEDAKNALERGESGSVDLFDFVLSAIESEGGRCQRRLDGVFEIQLPPSWNMDPSKLPGFDDETGVLLLSNDPNVIEDSDGKQVGYLGRAHPLVQKAIDRVRGIGFGRSTGQDRRVSAAATDADRPQLLCTFLGRVTSKSGREYEQVIAVKVDAAGNVETCLTPKDWLEPLKGRAINTRDVWKDHFADWGETAQQTAIQAARDAFASIGTDFIKKRRSELEAEERQHKEWLREMADQLIGKAETARMQSLFDADSVVEPSASAWKIVSDPMERLASFATDKTNPRERRNQAETILRAYERRMKDLSERVELSQPEVVPLGLLMLVPAKEVRRGS
ncbi:MAG: helicase-related protein [Armatimonadota bacterium]